MSRLDNWIDNKLLQNLVIWVFLLLIFAMIIQAENRIIASLIVVAFILPPIYLCNLKIVPLFFKGKRIVGTLLFFLNILIFTSIGVYFLSSFFQEFEWKMFYNVFGGVLLAVLFGASLKLSRDSFIRRQEEKDAELKLLKAQLNPHFLFNTLNNLYGLSVIKSDKLPDLMLKLSDLLRYSLYETKETFVPLSQEIMYLENYMSLEKIRLENKTSITFTANGDFSEKQIAPMLLIVFVENAFKHLGSSEENRSNVLVNLKLEGDILSFACENSIDKMAKFSEKMETGKSGIGLTNARKRLDLIYSNQYELNTHEHENVYKVHLKLQLK